eukprot:4418492-Prymnesium_polylepis.1
MRLPSAAVTLTARVNMAAITFTARVNMAAVTLTARVNLLLWLRGGGGGAESGTVDLCNLTVRLEKATNRLGSSLGWTAAPQPTDLPDVRRLMHAINSLSSVVEQLEKRKGEDEEAVAVAALTKATSLPAMGEEASQKAAADTAEQTLAEQVVSREQAAEITMQASGEKEEPQVASMAERVVNAQSAGDVVVRMAATNNAVAQAMEPESAKWPRFESVRGLEPHDFGQLLSEKYCSGDLTHSESLLLPASPAIPQAVALHLRSLRFHRLAAHMAGTREWAFAEILAWLDSAADAD